MNPSSIIEQYGDRAVLASGGLLAGILFGFFAQRSGFCFRSAVVEFWQRQFEEKLPVWLLAFFSAIVAVQILILFGGLDVSTARHLASRGSLSGALVGGLLFGAGMIMTRGCASRLLVLSANGNLRALLSGLIFAVTVQAALSGALSPLRSTIGGWWTIEGGEARDLLARTGLGHWGALFLGLVSATATLYFSIRRGLSVWMGLGGVGIGLVVALGWWFTWLVSTNSFEVVQVQGLTFSAPSAEWLMRILATPTPPMDFDFGLIPGVVAGSFIAAWMGKDLQLEGFTVGHSMPRYISGAVLMGFGSVLAAGCSIGAGMTGGAIFALTALLALLGMWVGGGLTDRLLDPNSRTSQHAAATVPPGIAA